MVSKSLVIFLFLIGLITTSSNPLPDNKRVRIHVPTKLHKVYVTKVVKVPEHHHHHYYVKKNPHEHEYDHEFDEEFDHDLSLDHNSYERNDEKNHYISEAGTRNKKPSVVLARYPSPSYNDYRKRRTRKPLYRLLRV